MKTFEEIEEEIEKLRKNSEKLNKEMRVPNLHEFYESGKLDGAIQMLLWVITP